LRVRAGRSVPAAAALIVFAVLLLTACGTNKANRKSAGKTFAAFKASWLAPDYMDPGEAYTLPAWQVFFNVYEGLVTYKHVVGPDGATLVPGLAASMPKLNATGTQFTFTLRKGLKYSDGKPVKASDFGATIERDFKLNSPGVGFYSNIVGVAGPNGYAKKRVGHIAGITADDATGTITIKLAKPESDFLYILALPFSAPVPASTPAKTTQSPAPPPSTGPYYIRSYKPNRSFLVLRNPYFHKQVPTVPRGNPNELKATIIPDQARAAQSVISGGADYDESGLPGDRLAQLEKKYGSRIKLSLCSCTEYLFLNEGLPPFSSLQAREAVNYGIDRNALLQFYGGLGRTTQNFLPPNYPQYKKIDAYSYDLAKARQLVAASGMKGTAVHVFGFNVDPQKSIALYLTAQLNKIGFKASPRLLGESAYFPQIGSLSTRAQIGYTGWLQDYPYPTDWFGVLLNGENIHPTGNNNLGEVNIRPLNKQIDRLATLSPSQANSPATNAAWARLDYDYVVTYSALVPYITRTQSDFFGPRINLGCYYFHVVDNFDWSTICRK
jgi:peptide/nickel transport system substrate-binding protein